MPDQHRHYFTLHQLMIMAALAALGGATGSFLSWVGGLLHAALGVPGGLQLLSGLHVLWLVLAIALICKPGAATTTALLKGAVEFLSANKHGLLVVPICLLGGICVDLVWLIAARRHNLIIYAIAGGFGATSNLVIFDLIVSAHRTPLAYLIYALMPVAFASGATLAGGLGWSLTKSLEKAGVTIPHRHSYPPAKQQSHPGPEP